MLGKFGTRQKKNMLDKFYTKPETSSMLVSKVMSRYDFGDFDCILEPSAGNGSFLKNLPSSKRLGLDISPDDGEIQKQDYFEWTPDRDKKYLVIGNPPFGRVSSLAIKFFEKSAEFADVIAFLVPRTFRRISVQNKLNMNFHLVEDVEVPIKPCAFEPAMSAKCCFQIWERSEVARKPVLLPTVTERWEFLGLGDKDDNNQPTPPVGADFAIRAYGSNCGKIVEEGLHTLRPKSWHWIVADRHHELIRELSSLDYSVSKDTARQDSLGRAELIYLYNEKYRRKDKK